jgi:hypothetical protein
VVTQRLDQLFAPSNGHDLDLVTLDQTDPAEPDAIAYVSRQGRKNGVSAYVKKLDEVEPAPAGTLTMALGGTYAAATFLQPRPYYTAQNVRVLTPRREMSEQEKLWWALCIQHNRYRFGYGRHANRTFRAIELPSAVPEWVLSAPVADLSPLREPALPSAPPALGEQDWNWFSLDSIFKVVRGRFVPVAKKAPGATPEVSSSAVRNGISRWIDLPAEHPAGSITVARNGSVGQAFYQPMPFFATDDVHVFYPREPLSREASLFACVLIRRERYRFNYGRKWSLEGMRNTQIRLPANGNASPDWSWVETFVKSLPFSGALN